MGFFSFCSAKFLVLVIFLGTMVTIESTDSPVPRGLQNVIRVGKRYGDDELWVFQAEDKRPEKLMAFPRIGRSSSSWSNDDSTEKRGGSNTGMWFGPRIGRSPPKINSDLDESKLFNYMLMNNEKPLSRHVHSSKRQEKDPEENEYDDLKELMPTY